jgi:hypothetical protein
VEAANNLIAGGNLRTIGVASGYATKDHAARPCGGNSFRFFIELFLTTD